MPDQQIQVNLEDDFVNDLIEKYVKKMESLENFKDKLSLITSSIDKLIENDNSDIKLCNEIKKVREETYSYSQKNLELMRKNQSLREYLELKKQKDDIELDIYENEMRRQLRINMIETKYLVPQSRQECNSVSQPINNIPIHPIATKTNTNIVAPPPPPPPMNTPAPPPPPSTMVPKENINDGYIKNESKPENKPVGDLSSELKSLLNAKFKGARGEDD